MGQTKAIDLGLSVKWADCNVGAENPWDAGRYFLWGALLVRKMQPRYSPM